MILLIDTAQQTSTVALSEDGRMIFMEENPVMNDSAGWLHEAIRRLLELAGINLRQLEAVAVIAGPGSYTGLRVGMAAAKGFCYALKIPLITQNTLLVMAESMREPAREEGAMVCPLIDARRDEVYTALYGTAMQEILPPQALILDKNSFELQLSQNRIVFFGSGAKKWAKINESPNAVFKIQSNNIQAFAKLVHQDFLSKTWADPVYSEPVYLKEFFSY